MDNLQPVSHLDPNDVPEGFTVADPNSSAGSGSAGAAASSGGGSADQDAQKKAILEQALTPDALARLNRIKLVKADKARKVSHAIVQMALAGQLPGRINEGKLIELLERGSAADARAAHNNNAGGSSSAGSGSIQIQRKKYADSDDDDDDNDDDL